MFAQRLKELRKGYGLTQTQFAQCFNVSSGAIGMWETGKREPDIDTINRLAQFFHVSTDYLLGNVNDPFFQLDNERILQDINSYGDEDEKAPTPVGGRSEDRDIRRIERAKKRMTEEEWNHQMKIMEASFGDYFSDDYEEDDLDE